MQASLARCAVIAALLTTAASAQFTHVIPNGLAATEGNSSNAFPWGRGATASLQIQTIYDSSHFTAASINFPILISRLRWRMNGTSTTTGGTYSNATVDMATATVDALTPSTTFAANMAADQTQVYAGPVTVLPASPAMSPGIWVCDIPLTTNFVYDPSSGNDLVIFSDLPPGVGTGVGSAQLDVQTTGSLASRVFNSTAYGSGTGTITANHGVVVEITYVPASGLFAGFSATPTGGSSPLMVQFTDGSFSSDPGGITSWAWDFDNDTIIDSTLQNPSHTYTGCGSYTVSLTVTDAAHPPSTLTKPNLIVTDAVDAGFTYSLLLPNTVQFTDTTTPAATSWAWDFDGDTIVDSTVQNPVHVYPAGTTIANVTLTASRLCGPTDAETQVVIPQLSLTTTLEGGNGLSATGAGNLFDITITNPLGVNFTGLVVVPWATAAGPVTCDVYVTDEPGGFLANHTNAAVWRLVATGSGNAEISNSTTPVPAPMTLNQSFYLAPGAYSMAIHMNGSGIVYTTGNGTNQNYSNADMSIAAGVGKGAPFNSSANNPRVWNGILIYDVCSFGGLAGYGFLDQGCAGSMGVPTLTATSLPKLGTTLSVDVDNLPFNAAIMLLGFSNTNSVFGPLPLDLGPFGAPGCFANVSNDSNTLILGAANTATWSLSIPNNPVFVCIRLHNQALVIDTGFNPLGAVTSDAAGMIIGN